MTADAFIFNRACAGNRDSVGDMGNMENRDANVQREAGPDVCVDVSPMQVDCWLPWLLT